MDRAYRGCPLPTAPRDWPAEPTRPPPGGRRPLHQRPLGPGAGAPYPPDTGNKLVADAATPAAHEQGDLYARAHGRHGSPTGDSVDLRLRGRGLSDWAVDEELQTEDSGDQVRAEWGFANALEVEDGPDERPGHCHSADPAGQDPCP